MEASAETQTSGQCGLREAPKLYKITEVFV